MFRINSFWQLQIFHQLHFTLRQMNICGHEVYYAEGMKISFCKHRRQFPGVFYLYRGNINHFRKALFTWRVLTLSFVDFFTPIAQIQRVITFTNKEAYLTLSWESASNENIAHSEPNIAHQDSKVLFQAKLQTSYNHEHADTSWGTQDFFALCLYCPCFWDTAIQLKISNLLLKRWSSKSQLP